MNKSTIQLLRFPFSYFLMPVFWFALSFVNEVDWLKAIGIFLILHVLVYPSSNGFNSFMDRDETSIGGIKNPMQPTRQLLVVTYMMDVIAVLLSIFISIKFAFGILVYILFSRAYSSRLIRLKKYAVLGFLTVIINQGALIFFLVYNGASTIATSQVPWQGLLAATFLIAGFYPITQVYQHEADKKDGVKTISMLLTKRGTFIFCSIMYLIALTLLWNFYDQQQQMWKLYLLLLFFVPVVLYFMVWFVNVWKDSATASFKNTMQMNWLASTCTSLAFITILIYSH